MWIFYAILSAISAALVAIFAKIGVEKISSNVATLIRTAIMFITMLIVVAGLRKLPEVTAVTGRPLMFIILSGLAGAVSYIFYFLALKLGPAAHVASIDRLSVVFVAVFAVIFLAEKISVTAGVGIALMSVGAILVAMK